MAERTQSTVPFEGRLRVFNTSPQQHFEEGFCQIYETRMKGLPIVNKRLNVNAGGFRRWGNDWIGRVVTPWSVLIIWACGNRDAWVKTKAGAEVTLELPAGEFGFLTAVDPILGEYRMLSLLSPMDQVEDQAAAELFADVALKTLLTVPEDERADFMEDDDPEMTGPGTGKVIPIKAKGAAPKPAQATVEPQVDRRPGVKEKRVTRRDFFKRFAG